MGKNLVYKTKEALAERGFFDKPTLRAKRLKPGPKQRPADQYWQGRGTVNVFALSECVPMCDYIMTPARISALQKARSLLGTALCAVCAERVDTDFFDAHMSMFVDCADKKRMQKRLAERDLTPLPDMPTVFLDIETTGLHASAGDEILELCICDDVGQVIINSLVKPTQKTDWPEAQAIHGIAPDDVKHAPTLTDLMPQVLAAVHQKRVVIYNSCFDVRFFPYGTFNAADSVECCMLRFSANLGEWNDYRNDWRWHKLSFAAAHVGHEWTGDAHRAHADVLATRSVWLWMQSGTPQPPMEPDENVPF